MGADLFFAEFVEEVSSVFELLHGCGSEQGMSMKDDGEEEKGLTGIARVVDKFGELHVPGSERCNVLF